MRGGTDGARGRVVSRQEEEEVDAIELLASLHAAQHGPHLRPARRGRKASSSTQRQQPSLTRRVAVRARGKAMPRRRRRTSWPPHSRRCQPACRRSLSPTSSQSWPNRLRRPCARLAGRQGTSACGALPALAAAAGSSESDRDVAVTRATKDPPTRRRHVGSIERSTSESDAQRGPVPVPELPCDGHHHQHSRRRCRPVIAIDLRPVAHLQRRCCLAAAASSASTKGKLPPAITSLLASVPDVPALAAIDARAPSVPEAAAPAASEPLSERGLAAHLLDGWPASESVGVRLPRRANRRRAARLNRGDVRAQALRRRGAPLEGAQGRCISAALPRHARRGAAGAAAQAAVPAARAALLPERRPLHHRRQQVGVVGAAHAYAIRKRACSRPRCCWPLLWRR